jgi:hypothetical protein
MPDYLDYNPSKEAVDKERKAAAERQRRRRQDMLSRRDNGVSHTTPTRPDPTPKTNPAGFSYFERPVSPNGSQDQKSSDLYRARAKDDSR